MSDAEEQLTTLASGQDWALDGADDFVAAAQAVKDALAGLQQNDGLESGQAADAAHAAALAISSQLEAAVARVKAAQEVVAAANAHRAEVARKLDALPEQPSWLAPAVRSGEAGAVILTGGLSVVVGETSLSAIGSYFAQQRAAAAEKVLASTSADMARLAEDLRAVVEPGWDYAGWTPTEGSSGAQGQPSASTSSATQASGAARAAHASSASADLGNDVAVGGGGPETRGQAGPTTPGPVTPPAGTAPGTGTDPRSGSAPSKADITDPASGSSPSSASSPWVAVDGTLNGTTGVPASGDAWSGASAGGGLGGLSGSGASRGLSAAALGGSTLGGAAIASGSRAAGGLGGSLGSTGSVDSTSGLAAGLGRTSGGTTGTGGLAAAGSRVGSAAEGEAAGSQAAASGGRSGGMLGGGGGQGSSKENKRRGLGGILAPTLEDDPEATPLPASAGAGSR